MAQSLAFFLVALLVAFASCNDGAVGAAYDVVDFGAKADGRTDSSNAFLRAWAATCSAGGDATMTVPSGRFFVSKVTFEGPCKSARIRVYISGTLVAPPEYGPDGQNWITFTLVQGVSIYGGTLDGQGQALWACKTAGNTCPFGATVRNYPHTHTHKKKCLFL